MPDDTQRQNLADAIQCLSSIASLQSGEASKIAGRTLATIVARRMGAPIGDSDHRRYPILIPSLASTKHKPWAKWVIGIDTTQPKGFAFEGPFLKVDQTHYLPNGALVIHHGVDVTTKLPLVDCWMVISTKIREYTDLSVRERDGPAELRPITRVVGRDWSRDLIVPFTEYFESQRAARKEAAK